MAEEIPTEALQAAARAAENAQRLHWHGPGYTAAGHSEPPEGCSPCSEAVEVVLAAAAPYLIAEGRRQAAAELREWCEDYRRSIGAGSDPHDAAARLVLGDAAREAARIAEGKTIVPDISHGG